MLEGYEICSVAPNSDIGYYAIKSPTPFKNRDFVTQRCWLDFGRNKEKYIINHSVNHLVKVCLIGEIWNVRFYSVNPHGKMSFVEFPI